MLYYSLYNLLFNTSQNLGYDVTFKEGRRQELNKFHDGKYPLMWLFPMDSTASFFDTYNRLYKVYACTIVIHSQDTMDSTPDQQREIISYCDAIATKFIIKLQDATVEMDDIHADKIVENIRFTPFYRDSSFVASGVILNFNITLPDDFNYCC